MIRVRAAVAVSSLALVVASCGVLDADRSEPVEDVAQPVDDANGGSAESGDAGSGGPSAAPVAVELEQRIGGGRAVLAATNGAQTVVATTVDVVVRSEVDAEFRALPLRAGEVRGVEVSPLGDRALIVTGDGAGLWAIDDELVEITRLDDVVSGEFRADGSIVIEGSRSVRVVDAADGAELDEWIVAEDRSLGPIAVADDGRILAAVNGGPSAEIVSWSGGDDPVTIETDAGDAELVVVRIATAGDRVALGLQHASDVFEGEVSILSIGSSEVVWTREMENVASSDAWMFTPSGGLLVGENSMVMSFGPDGAPKGSTATELPIERITRNGLIVVSDGSVLQRREDGALDEVVVGSAPVVDLHADRVSGASVVVDTAGRVVIVSDPEDEPEIIGDFAATPVNDVAVAADGRIATASTDGVVNVSTSDGEPIARLAHDEGNVDSVAFAGGENRVATGVAQRRTASAWDDTVSVWDQDEAARVFEIGGEVEEVAGCSFFTNRLRYSNDGTFVVSTSHDFTVSVIAVPSGELLHTFEPHGNTVLDIAISADDSTLVTSADDSTMRVWDLETYELIAEHPATMGGYWSLSFLPDDASVVAGDLTGNLSVIDIATGTPTITFDGDKLREARTAVSPDGSLVAAGGDGSVVRLWSVGTGEVVGEAIGHSGDVTAVAFFADSQRFVSSSEDGTAIVWRLTR